LRTLAEGGREGNLPALLLNLILPICGSVHPQKASKPPPTVFGKDLLFIIVT